MPAGKYDIIIDQGSDFSVAITLSEAGVARDISDWLGRAKIKKSLTDSSSTDFNVSMSNAASGIIVMSLAHSVSRDMSAGFYIYDLEIYKGTAGSESEVTRVIEGRITLKGEVTT